VIIAEGFCNRLTVPARMRDRVMRTTRFHMHLHKLSVLNGKTWVNMFAEMDALRDPEVVTVLYQLGICDHRGRLGSEADNIDHLDLLNRVFEQVQRVKFADIFPKGETNHNRIRDGLRRARVAAVNQTLGR
jgi:tRNA nucleotidyltransferase (CCA-adding enzyme)